MPNELSISLPLTPPTVNSYKKPCVRNRRGGGKRLSFELTPETKAFYAAIGVYNHGNMLPRRTPADQYLVSVMVYWPNLRIRDVDNAGKCILDGLKMCGAIEDDRYVRRVTIEKSVDRENPRTEIEVRYA